jgi:hypothetical protein
LIHPPGYRQLMTPIHTTSAMSGPIGGIYDVSAQATAPTSAVTTAWP